ncbi:MAG TPA: DoxX family protein, partial [Burkholderiales bacterium]
MEQTRAEPRLLVPALRPFYDALEPLSWLLVRCAAGLILAVHGWGKVAQGAGAYEPAFVKMGYQNPTALIWFICFVELVGGIGIALGL